MKVKEKQSLRKRKVKKPKKNQKEKQHRNTLLSFTRNMSIGAKYLSIFIISVILFMIATGLVFFQLNKVRENVSDIVDKNELTHDMSQVALLVEQQNSVITDYILVDNQQKITEYEEITEQLEALFDKLEQKFTGDKDNLFFIQRVKEMNDEIQDVFTEKITNPDIGTSDAIYAQIQISSQKSSSVASINRLINTVDEEQVKSVDRIKKSLSKSMLILISASIISILTGLIIMFIVSKLISRHLKKVVSITKDISRGNLTVEKMEYEGKDEIGQLAGAINLLRNNMNNVLEKVSHAAQSVSSSSGVLNASSKEVKEGSKQMVHTMEELATGAETQANSAANLSETMQHFLESVQVSQQEGHDITEASHGVLSLTTDGAKLMHESIQQMNQIDHIVSNAVDQVRGLDNQSDQISKLVQVVKDIADQTNLLALNAAIEAARAGEHGKGFAVVADEVRKLAEQVTNSITEITGIVSSIQHETNEVVTSLSTGYKEVKTGIVHIEKTGKNFNTIDDSVTSMVKGVEQVAHRLGEIAANSQQMNTLISDIAAVSEEAAAGIEQTSASTQQSSSSMDEITTKADDLAALAKQLNQEVAVFQLK